MNNSPASTMAAPAVHRSHSPPDLFLDSSPLSHHHHQTPPPSSSVSSPIELASGVRPSAETQGSPIGGKLPPIDFGPGVETNLAIETKVPTVEVSSDDVESTATATATAKSSLPVPPIPPEPTTMAAPKGSLSATKRRSRSIVDRPKSWLTSKSTSASDGSELKEKSTVLTKSKKTDEKEVKDGQQQTIQEQRKSLSKRERAASFKSSSFADFAKKSWISSSRSPSPKPSERSRRGSLKGEEGVAGGDGTPKKEKETSLLSPHKLTRRRPGSAILGDTERSKSAESLNTSGSGSGSGSGGTSTPTSSSSSSTGRALNRASAYFGKKKPQAKSPNLGPIKTGGNGNNLTVPSLGQSTKSENASPAPSTRSASGTINPRLSSQTDLSATSDTSSGGTGSTAVTEPSQVSHKDKEKPQLVRDPLWATFRRLDSEYSIFLTKTSTAQRVLIARNTLIPFLRNHGSLNSAASRDSTTLSPEDIDRRATILHKWWNGLLELLEGSGPKHGHGNGTGPATTFAAIQVHTAPNHLQPVSGVDRPALLELITFIMMRPEWRICTPSFRPLKDRPPQEAQEKMRGRHKTRDSTDFLDTESAEHNVRTMFVNNLLTQMGIVVDKMSGRHAPASLVTFCGKACAYAFFFVPGIAEVLVRLWGLTTDLLRRIADELGLPRRSKTGSSEEMVALFPPSLHKLGWTSVKAMTDNLRLTTKLSLVAAKIPWHGPWVSRWRGADSDLFFIFCKYYYILTDEFLPAGLSLSDKAKAPGFSLIHAQLLSVLDTTIHHRQAAFENMMAPYLPDNGNGADAMATALAQLPPSNLLRGMDENRLIVLLKDMLAQDSIGGLVAGARETFAAAFMAMLKAAAKKTPVFKQAPVLVLIDFFHEVLQALDAYTGYTDSEYADQKLPDFVDWPFWLEVFHRILFESNSTMSEIRILSFIFAAWDILTADPVRKEKLCIDWLLSKEVFDKFFNNYTPMVRGYFMRLLCWRICRDQGSPNELDMRIFSLVADRLRLVWSHYLWLKQAAEEAGKLPPSTAPCHPQPGKRFMIIRMETSPPQTGLLQQTGFDTMNSTWGHEMSSPLHDTFDSGSDDLPTANSAEPAKRRWSIFGKMLSFSSNNPAGSSASSNNGDGSDTPMMIKRTTPPSSSRTGPPIPPPKVNPRNSNESDASSTGSAPVYTAAQFVFKFTLGALPWNPHSATDMGDAAATMLSTLPRERPLTRPRLPAPAQARVSARAGDSPPPPPPGLPPPQRMYSGTSQGGLVSDARNATPLDEPEDKEQTEEEKRNEASFSDFNFNLPEIMRVASIDSAPSPTETSPVDSKLPAVLDSTASPLEASTSRGRTTEPTPNLFITAVQPVGLYRERATYSGRALAEWGLVVHECNSFIDRRRDEGVCGLKEVEVPSLGVENLRRMG